MKLFNMTFLLLFMATVTALSARPSKPSQIELRLKKGILELDYQKVKQAVESGVSVNRVFPGDAGWDEYSQDPQTPLQILAYSCEADWSSDKIESMVKIAEYLISKGANVNWQQKFKVEGRWNYGRYPLYSAAECVNKELVDVLLDAGAEQNRKFYHHAEVDNNNTSPLSATVGDFDAKHLPVRSYIVENLLKNGGKKDVNRCSSYGWTPLLSAIQGLDNKTVELLIQYGARVNFKCPRGEYAEAPMEILESTFKVCTYLENQPVERREPGWFEKRCGEDWKERLEAVHTILVDAGAPNY